MATALEEKEASERTSLVLGLCETCERMIRVIQDHDGRKVPRGEAIVGMLEFDAALEAVDVALTKVRNLRYR